MLIDPAFAFSRQDYEEDGAGGEVQGTAFAEDGAGTTRLRICATSRSRSFPDRFTAEASRFTSAICRGRPHGKI